MLSISPFFVRALHHAEFAYSNSGLTIALYGKIKVKYIVSLNNTYNAVSFVNFFINMFQKVSLLSN